MKNLAVAAALALTPSCLIPHQVGVFGSYGETALGSGPGIHRHHGNHHSDIASHAGHGNHGDTWQAGVNLMWTLRPQPVVIVQKHEPTPFWPPKEEEVVRPGGEDGSHE